MIGLNSNREVTKEYGPTEYNKFRNTIEMMMKNSLDNENLDFKLYKTKNAGNKPLDETWKKIDISAIRKSEAKTMLMKTWHRLGLLRTNVLKIQISPKPVP